MFKLLSTTIKDTTQKQIEKKTFDDRSTIVLLELVFEKETFCKERPKHLFFKKDYKLKCKYFENLQKQRFFWKLIKSIKK